MVYSLFEQNTTCPISLGWNKPDDSILQDKSLNRVTTCNRKLPVTASKDFVMVKIHVFNNICRTTNNNIHKDHDQFIKKKPVLNKQNKNTFTVFHQNICALLNIKELLHSLTSNPPTNYLYNRTSLSL
jgi:hypothetical protein